MLDGGAVAGNDVSNWPGVPFWPLIFASIVVEYVGDRTGALPLP